MAAEKRVSESARPGSVNVCAQGPFVMHRMEDAPLIAKEWNQVAWGNFETNLEFLRRVGFGAGHLTLLEIGCGKGALLSRLQAMGHSVWGIDRDIEAIAFCKANHPEIGACAGLGEKLPFGDHVFDTVLSFDVFEHIADSDQHLREVRRVLKPAGAYLLQTPNKWGRIFHSTCCATTESWGSASSPATIRSSRTTAPCTITGSSGGDSRGTVSSSRS
jgi:2-polyprenyl-3-methyl-5-hydroxy-6-metoxy-1,4-benzoquinol methylase